MNLISNKINKLKIYESYQLEYDGELIFESSDKGILDINNNGLIKAYANGIVTIKVIDNNNNEDIFDIEVYTPGYLDISFDTTSYVYINKTIKINASYIVNNKKDLDISYISKSDNISVDNNGVVTGLSKGVGTINVKSNKYNEELDIFVTVLDTVTKEESFIINNHHSNALVTYNLGIGAGIPEYYYDIVSNINKLMFKPLVIDKTYHDKLPLNVKNNGYMNKVEFITVHYTGNMHYGADADNNCSYFNNLEYKASIHYVTGRTNLYHDWNEDEYCAFAGLGEQYKGWHASDSLLGEHEWLKTNVLVSSNDPINPKVSISKNGYFTINGKETIVKIPDRPDGIKIEGPTFIYEGKTCQAINKMGIATKIINGEYYLGNTWWGKQQFGLTLCNIGGNHNSIGIESCVDIGSNLMHTWHVTAKLCADIMKRYNLDISRVVGHHYFSGKNCPQPMLENNLSYWNYFIEMTKAEYELITTYKDTTFTLEVINGEGVVNKDGLITLDDKPHCVKYKVTINNGNTKEELILSTMVESKYKGNFKRDVPSLQMIGYDIR